jgi:hypothetical protein
MESGQFNILARDTGVTINGFWSGDSIYCTFLHTARDYTLQFTFTHTLSVHSHVFVAIAL